MREAAAGSGLHYVSTDPRGIRRRRRGRGFVYVDPDGRPLTGDRTLGRIRELAIPPAWTDVWICTDPRGHIQAVGQDSRGRRQYRYHRRWLEVRDEAKFDRLLDFGRALPRIRRRVARDLARPGLPEERVTAAVVRLLDKTLIRIGNERYARENGSYGLTTLLEHHVKVDGEDLELSFQGKLGHRYRVRMRDRRMARIVDRLLELPGQQLFRYVDAEGELRSLDSSDVNRYLQEAGGDDFTAKDFRTWAATVLALERLTGFGPPASEREAKRRLKEGIAWVADALGNTATICRKCYVAPAVMEAYLDGRLKPPSNGGGSTAGGRGLSSSERALTAFLRRQRRREAKARREAA